MPHATSSRRHGARALALVGALGAALGLSACAPDPVSESYLNGENLGYIAADGFTVVEIPSDQRGDPVVFGGETDLGGSFRSEDLHGDVAVVNFWYAGCGPCRAEAPDLEGVWQKFQAESVQFVGVNTRDQQATALSFTENYGITYPSILDANTGDVKLAFAKAAPMQTTPITVVLDREGRVAARIIGALEGQSILSSLVTDALSETP